MMSFVVDTEASKEKEDSKPASKPLITVKEWHSVALWNWDIPVEQCAICKNALSDVCVDCYVRGVHHTTDLPTLHDLVRSAEKPTTHVTTTTAEQREEKEEKVTHRTTPELRTNAEANDASHTSDESAHSTSEDAFASRRSSPGPEAAQGSSHHEHTSTQLQAQQTNTSSSLSSRLPPSARLPKSLQSMQSGCAIAWGSCGHVFHNHCIVRWLQHRQICPNCGELWKLYKLTSND